MKSTLPIPSPGFTARKNKILSDLAVPLEEYIDASPKGSVDVGIRDLIDEINAKDGFVTTSSCAGRVSVYLEGQKIKSSEVTDEPDSIVSSSGGGKGGGDWLYVSHDAVPFSENYGELFGLGNAGSGKGTLGEAEEEEERRLIRFKFEPMILHVLTASHGHAQLVIQAGMEAGFRETGAVSLLAKKPNEDPTPIVAVRSMGLSFESVVGMQDADGNRWSPLGDASECYLKQLVHTSHKLFAENQKRIARFRAALDMGLDKGKKKGGNWEDAEARRERKRLEGLKRREDIIRARKSQGEEEGGGDTQLGLGEVMLEQPDVL